MLSQADMLKLQAGPRRTLGKCHKEIEEGRANEFDSRKDGDFKFEDETVESDGGRAGFRKIAK